MEDGESTTALIDWMCSKVRDFKNRHVSFWEDHLLGILLQHATHSWLAISNLVMNKLEAIVSTYSQPPNPGQVIAAIESSTQQVMSKKEMTTPKKTSLPTFQKLNVAGGNGTEEMGNDEFLKGSFNPEDLCAMVWGTCHFARNCPKNKDRTQTCSKHITQSLPLYKCNVKQSIQQ
ncbi:hypothetical protein O181_002416 [Austropuccinia psidii MF-1]|uniref:Uncharacterized protein n=1 Tax=Austropuccinia psidii MF-1 TaxID=1389203 RepID=A0A9Q3GD92_9BASI|nr:hypothetical protein [Austropuccinia psidii MF-1]